MKTKCLLLGCVILFVLIICTIVIINFDQIKLFYYYKLPFTRNIFEKQEYIPKRIAILTAEDRNMPYIRYHDKNFQEYCDLHGYSYIRLDNCSPDEASIYWCKIYKTKELLETNKYDYVMWADSDTIIPDKSVSLDLLLSDLGEPDILIGKDNNSGNVINAGLYIIKNSEIGVSFINDCLSYIENKINCILDGKEQGIWAGICYEQGVMNLLVREKYDVFTFVDTENILFLNQLNKDETVMSNPVFLHLAGFPNKIRNEVFEKLK